MPSVASSSTTPARLNAKKLAANDGAELLRRAFTRASSQSTIGGPLTLIEVVSAPLVKPTSQSAGRTGRLARPAAAQELPRGREDDRHPDRHLKRLLGQLGESHQADRQAGHGGHQHRHERPPVHVLGPAVLEEHEQIERKAQREQGRDRLGRLEHREERRAQHQREAEARGRLDKGAGQGRERGEGHQSTVTSSFGNPVSASQPSSVTTTRSSMRTPKRSGR